MKILIFPSLVKSDHHLLLPFKINPEMGRGRNARDWSQFPWGGHGSISHPQGQTWGRNLGEKTGSNRTTVAYSIRSALPWTFSLISRLFDERLYRCCRGRSHEEGWSAYGVVHRHPRICRWYQRLTSWTSWLLLVNFDALVMCANGCLSLTTLFGSGWRKGEWNG